MSALRHVLSGILFSGKNRLQVLAKTSGGAGFGALVGEELSITDTIETVVTGSVRVKWSTKTGHRVRVFSSIDFPIRLVVTHHYIRAVLVRCNIQRYSPLLRELHR